MADISKITLPDNSQYNFKDAALRETVKTINNVYISKTQPAIIRQGLIWLRLIDDQEEQTL